MKKVYTVLVFLLVVGFQAVSQQVKSCMDYDPDRTLDEFKVLVLTSQDPFMKKELWPEYARLANRILKTSHNKDIRNFVVTPDRVGMEWLMQHTVEYEWSYFKQDKYHNGGKFNGKKLGYRDVIGNESSWAVLEVGDISGETGLYGKIACCNSQDPKIPLVEFVPPKIEQKEKPEGKQPKKEDDEWDSNPVGESTKSLAENDDFSYQEPVNLNRKTETKKVIDLNKTLKIGGISIVTAGIITGGIIYALNKKSSASTDTGGGRITPPSHPSTGGK